MSQLIKEYPILFSAPMVLANRAGLKNMTRRVVKFPKAFLGGEEVEPDNLWIEYAEKAHSGPGFYVCFAGYESEGWELLRCPYGKPGDRLWVRESFRLAGGVYLYKADIRYPQNEAWHKWKPSIHMPRWACRDVYPVVSVRVERLHDITEADAIAEGVEVMGHYDGEPVYMDYLEDGYALSAVDSYKTLWVKLNGAASWAANPWLWVVEYDNPMWKGGAV